MIDFYTDDSEGIMPSTADTIEVLQLKQSLKKSQPASWQNLQSGKGKEMGYPCKCKLKCFEKVTEKERQEVFLNIGS